MKPRYCVVTAEPVTDLVQRLLVYKAFGVYPRDMIDYKVKPDLVKDKSQAYVIDLEEILRLPEWDFDKGDLDPYFLTTKIPFYEER